MAEQTVELRISGIDCAECASGLEQALTRLPGVRYATVLLGAEKETRRRPASAVDGQQTSGRFSDRLAGCRWRAPDRPGSVGCSHAWSPGGGVP